MSFEQLHRLQTLDAPDERVDDRSRWIRVIERRAPEAFEASFAFELAGVSPRRLDREPLDPGARRSPQLVDVIALAAVASTVGANVLFEYRGGGSHSSGCECLVIGSTVASTRGEAVNRLWPLWRQTADSLGRAGGDYVFEPLARCTEMADDEAVIRLVRWTRPSVLLTPTQSTPAGFASGRPAEAVTTALLIPIDGAWGALDHIVVALASASSPVSVRISLASIALTSSQIDLAARASSQLNDSTPKAFAYAADRRYASPDRALQAELSRTLACWVRRPRGFRIAFDVKVVGADDIPASVRAALQHDMPGLVPMAERGTTPVGALDLSELAHEDLGLPGVLPTRGRLFDIGVRAIVASEAHRLPMDGPVVGRLPGAGERVLRVPEASRHQHTYLVGASGAGKSTVIYNSIVHDLARGHGVCLLDPHGELFDRVLESIPEHRVDDVIVVDPYDPEWVVGLNLLAIEGPDAAVEQQKATSEMLRLFDRLYDLHETGGPVFEMYVRNAMFLVMGAPLLGGTLIEVVRVFEDEDFRDRLLDACPDEAARAFWKKQAGPATGEISLSSVTPYVTSKLNQFTQNAFVRPIVGQRESTISFGDALNGKIVLVNLAVGRLGMRDAQLLGMLVVAKVCGAAFARGAEAPRMHVYLDEFHYFLTDTMVGALSQCGSMVCV